jgi:hypothetical protein
MKYGRFRGVALAGAALLSVSLAACDDDNGGGPTPDFSAADDLSMNGDMAGNPDMAAAAAPTALIVAADVVGHPWMAIPGTDMGMPFQLSGACAPNCPATVHQLDVIIDLPAMSGDSLQDGTELNGCTANRYDLTTTPPHIPPVSEPAGTVQVTGYDTTYTNPLDVVATLATGSPVQTGYGSLDPDANCSWSMADGHFHCIFGSDKTHPLERYAFIEQPDGASPTPFPSPSPTPPPLANHDLWYGSPQATIKFTTAGSGTTYTDSRTANLQAPIPEVYITGINGDNTKHSLENLEGLFGTGQNQITVDYSCEAGNTTKGAKCAAGGITGLLLQTSAGRKWDSTDPGATNPFFGVIQCVDTDAGASTHTITLKTNVLQKALGAGPNQTLRVVMVRLKASPTVSGAHGFYQTAGHGQFAFISP